MIRKNYQRGVLLAVIAMLGACGMFGKDKVQLDGERVAVLKESKMLAPDFEPNQIKITLPKPYTNKQWSQEGGNSRHVMAHLNCLL